MVSKKVVADQGMFLPFFLGTFIVLNGYLKGDKHHQIARTFRQEYWSMLKISYFVWIPAQVFNFSLISLPYRVLFCNLVGLGWNAYLAYRNK